MSVGSRIKSQLKTTPYRFQVQGVRFLEGTQGRALIGDDMGLGKSLQAIAWIAIHPELRPVVILCPSSLKWNWVDEFQKHAGISATVLEGKEPRNLTGEQIVIVNYEILVYWLKHISLIDPKVLVVDECHYVKTMTTNRTKSTKILSEYCPHIIALSGTPIINRPIEFYPILHMIAPHVFDSRWNYGIRYCSPTKEEEKKNKWKNKWRRQKWGYIADFSHAHNLQELHEKVQPFMIRRMKSEVLKELPKKVRIPISISIPMEEYTKAEKDFIEWLKGNKGEKASQRAKKAMAIIKIGVLKRLAALALLPQAIEWINNFLKDTNQKLVVFCIHRTVFQILYEKYPEAAVIGRNTSLERREQVNKFQTDPKCRLLIGALRPAGTGWTLTAASTTLSVEIGWTPGEHDQAEDRVHRIGQEAESITAYYLIPKDTVVETTMRLIDRKRSICSQVLDGEDLLEETINTVDQLIHHYERGR